MADVKLSVQSNAAAWSAFLNGQANQLPFACALALTRTVIDVRADQAKQMQSAFKSPVKFTLNAATYTKATKSNLEASVQLNARGDRRYLVPEVEGDARHHTKFEGKLRGLGFLRSSEYVVPGSDAKVDANGNVLPKLARAIISSITTKGGKYFVADGTRGGLHRGVYRRVGRGGRKVRCVLVFAESRPVYSSKYHFFDVARQKAIEVFDTHLTEAVRQALGTAKK